MIGPIHSMAIAGIEGEPVCAKDDQYSSSPSYHQVAEFKVCPNNPLRFRLDRLSVAVGSVESRDFA